MAIENYYEEESKKAKLSEEDRKLEIAKKLEYSKDKNILLGRIEKDKSLTHLKSVIERGLIGIKTVGNLIDGKNLELSEVNEILSKIDEILEVEKIDEILPIELRVTKEEYLDALENTENRIALISKINQALNHMHRLSNPFAGSLLDLFSGLFISINKNLVKVQEITIDIKNNLENK